MTIPSLLHQETTLPGIIYIGKTPTTEYNPLYSKVFHQRFYNPQAIYNTLPSTFKQSKTQGLSLYGQAIILAGIKYIGRTTTGNNFIYPMSSTNISKTYEGNKNIFNHHNIPIGLQSCPQEQFLLYSTCLGNKMISLSRYSYLPYVASIVT